MQIRLYTFLVVTVITCDFALPAELDWTGALHARLTHMADELTASLKPWRVPEHVYRVEDFGAVADGVTVNTKSINQAIVTCATNGGGLVLFSRGDYVTGTLDLKSGVMLEIAAGARILASTNLVDFPNRIARRRTVMDSNMGINQSLIFAEGCERIGIRGAGEINGRGSQRHFPGAETIGPTLGRPFLIRVIDCQSVLLNGVTLKDAACWMQNYLNCESLLIENVTVENQANWNNDGMDIDSCRNVIVRGCRLNSEDDGLCFKGAGMRPMENVLVEDCQLFSTCNALKFGTDSQGDFRNVLIRNVELGGPPPGMRALIPRRASSGISLESVDGGTVENVLVTNISIFRAESPLFLRLGNRGRTMPEFPKPPTGVLRRVVFQNITGNDNGSRGSIFAGIPQASIEDVLVSDLRLSVAGGGKTPPATPFPEKAGDYPDASMFGDAGLAYGFWFRHVHGLRFVNVAISPGKPDARSAFISGGDAAGVTLDGKPFGKN